MFFLTLSLVVIAFLVQPLPILYAQDSESESSGDNGVIDKLPTSGDQTLDIIILLLTGGAITTWLTFLFDNVQKNRSLLLDINKHKVETLSTMIPTYSRLSSSSASLAREFQKPETEFDMTLCLYLFCHLFLAYQEMLIKAGGIQLTSNVGEKVVAELITDIYTTFLGIGIETIHFMRGLVDQNTSFYVFKNEVIVYNMPFYSKFYDFIHKMDAPKRKDMKNKCDWLYRVLGFEMNQLYRHWYTSEHITISVDEDEEFINYLRSSENTKPFIDRLNRLNTTRKQKIARLLQLEHHNLYSKEI